MRTACLHLLLIICCGVARSQSTDSLLIHFEYNRSAITPAAAHTLDSLLQTVSTSTIKQISLSGHCDFIGSDGYNDSLSVQRVKAAREYLLRKGLSPALFSSETGWGKQKPLDPATTDAARATNRRVELIFVREEKVVVTEEPVRDSPPSGGLAALLLDTATKTGTTLVLPNMHFAPGRHILLQHSYPVLEELRKVMEKYPSLQIEIHGHICCISGGMDGPDMDLGTNDLSVQRAKAVYNYLVKAGISPSRMNYRGFGSSRKLVANERTETEATKNRRVEIKIVNR